MHVLRMNTCLVPRVSFRDAAVDNLLLSGDVEVQEMVHKLGISQQEGRGGAGGLKMKCCCYYCLLK